MYLVTRCIFYLQSKDEAIQVLKRTMQEKNLSSEGTSPASHSDKVVALLEEKIKEREEMINNNSQRISALEKDAADKQTHIKTLEKLVEDKTAEVQVLQESVHAKDQELQEIKEKHETELSEKEMKLESQTKMNAKLEETIVTLRESLAGLESKENINERLLLLDAEKEQQFRNEKEAFKDSQNALHAQLQSSLDKNNKIAEELASAKTEIEAKEKEIRDLSAKMGKLKIQVKAKLTSLQNEKEKLAKDMQEVHVHVVLYSCVIGGCYNKTYFPSSSLFWLNTV